MSPAGDAAPDRSEDRGVLNSSAVMAAGTVVSRMSGLVRSGLLVAALGQSLHADVFNIANTIPNMLYILLAGGIFNAVLVPQLVRSMRNDEDGGAAYTNRVITLAALFLGAVSLVLVVAAPWVMQVFLNGDFNQPEVAAQRQSAIDFARYCLPQVFFYGMFVLVGQILNARGRFGPMMWAPIANNVISILVLVTYLFVFGPTTDPLGAYTQHQELLLGLGSTLGILAQLLILLPYLKSAGFSYRPRFDFRNTGLGHTLRLGLWTVLFVIVNQIAYAVVVRLASGGTSGTALGAGGEQGTGYTVYSYSFLIAMVPHSVITVSLATAILPTLSDRAAAGDLTRIGSNLVSALRTTLVVIVPFAALLPVVSPDLAKLLFGYGAAANDFQSFVPTLSLFGVGLVFFTVHYLMLRGFYALERTRTVFWIQCVVAAVNIVAALVLVARVEPSATSPALVLAYIASYAVGASLSFVVLNRLLGGMAGGGMAGGGMAGGSLIRFGVRLAVAVACSVIPAYLVAQLLRELSGDSTSWWAALGELPLLSGLAVGMYLLIARLLHLDEVGAIVDTVTARLPGRRSH